MSSTTPAQQLTELRRELATRQRVYPDWVRAGKLSEAAAAHRVAVLLDLIAALELLHPPAPVVVQAQLFAPGQLPQPQPRPGMYADH